MSSRSMSSSPRSHLVVRSNSPLTTARAAGAGVPKWVEPMVAKPDGGRLRESPEWTYEYKLDGSAWVRELVAGTRLFFCMAACSAVDDLERLKGDVHAGGSRHHPNRCSRSLPSPVLEGVRPGRALPRRFRNRRAAAGCVARAVGTRGLLWRPRARRSPPSTR
ncbi:hypothetical protein CVV72_05780 [Amycolatopsis sp. TNS106]|nr:hypothetical protein CVV72_05780 [Amycolatopsis sp. TNS106]